MTTNKLTASEASRYWTLAVLRQRDLLPLLTEYIEYPHTDYAGPMAILAVLADALMDVGCNVLFARARIDDLLYSYKWTRAALAEIAQ